MYSSACLRFRVCSGILAIRLAPYAAEGSASMQCARVHLSRTVSGGPAPTRCNTGSGPRLRFGFGFPDAPDPVAGPTAEVSNGQDEQTILLD